MASLDEIRSIRLEKIEKLKEAGMNPYPIDSDPDYIIQELDSDFTKLSKKKKLTAAGRILSKRGQGAIVFFDIDDGTGKFQCLLKRPEKSDTAMFELFKDTTDIGDFVEVTGNLFKTKRKEKTIEVASWKMLSKSLRPLPEKWHGLKDDEERYRRRYLETATSHDTRDKFISRSKMITFLRHFLDDQNFLEVETPMLQPIAGGTNALPFLTHYNALDIDLYLRIAPELFLKRLLVGNFPKVYELNRNFRNEGIDATHSPEFTMLEYYQAYSCASEQMKFTEDMLKKLVKVIKGKRKLTFGEQEIDFTKKFKVISFYDLLSRYALVDNPASATKVELATKAQQLGVSVQKSDSRGKVMDLIYKKACRPKLVQPTFVVDYPAEYLPLAKRSEKDKDTVDAFQLVVAGLEIVKAFSELNDPIDQRTRFEEQEKDRKAGDAEAQRTDEDFLEALEHGMPPAGGVGIGIDRLAMLLTDTHNIRDVILFPTLKPRDINE